MIEIKKHYYNNYNQDINIMMFGDLHYSDKFNYKKLSKLSKILDNNVDYLLIAGDLIDSTDIINNEDRIDKLISFLKELESKYKVFITLGNHDITKRINNNKILDINDNFWKEINNIDNIFVSRFNNYYEDDKIIVYMLELTYDYYYKNKRETKEILLDKIKKDKKNFKKLDKNKIKIVVCHSPIYMDDKDIIKELRGFDFVFCGHMHNGMIPYFSSKIIKGNRGIISPDSRLFIENARGVKIIDNIHLIINGGITKLSKTSKLFRYFNFIYPSSIDNIIINSKK